MPGEGIQDLRTQLARSQEELVLKCKEVERLELMVQEAKAEAAEAQERAASESARVRSLQQELENLEMRGELTMLRAVDRLRAEYQLVLTREGEMKATEQKRMDAWVQDLKDSHQAEKERLLERIATLEKDSSSGVSGATGTTEHVRSEFGSGASEGDDPVTTGSSKVGSADTESPPVTETTPTVSTARTTLALTPATPMETFSASGVTSTLVSAPVSTPLSPSVTSAAGVVVGATPGTATTVAGASAAGIVVGGTSGIATTAAGASAAGTTAGTISAGTPMSMSMTPAVTTVTPSGLPAAGTSMVPLPVTGTGPSRVTPALSPAAVEFVPTIPAMVSHSVVPTASPLVSGTVPSPSETTRVSDPFIIPVSSTSTSGVVSESSGVAGMSTGTGTVPGTSETMSSAEGVVETFTRQLRAQTDVIAAQAKAVAVQNLPSLNEMLHG